MIAQPNSDIVNRRYVVDPAEMSNAMYAPKKTSDNRTIKPGLDDDEK